MKIIKNTVLTFLLVTFTMSAAQAQLLCDRSCLTAYVDTYFQSLADNNPSAIPLSDNVKITENGRIKNLPQTFWANADSVVYRWDIVNERMGDTGTEAIIKNADGSQTMFMLRLKILDGKITEIETIKANEGEADGLWDPDRLVNAELSPNLQMSIREAERDSYYRLIAAAESYWRAFQTNGTETYHPADLLPDATRFENGLQTTGLIRNGVFASTASGFDRGSFIGRNLWDRRYSVVDEEKGVVLSMVRFGLKDGMESQSFATTNDRLVAEFFVIKSGMLQEIHAVLFNLDDSVPSVWDADYGPSRGGW